MAKAGLLGGRSGRRVENESGEAIKGRLGNSSKAPPVLWSGTRLAERRGFAWRGQEAWIGFGFADKDSERLSKPFGRKLQCRPGGRRIAKPSCRDVKPPNPAISACLAPVLQAHWRIPPASPLRRVFRRQGQREASYPSTGVRQARRFATSGPDSCRIPDILKRQYDGQCGNPGRGRRGVRRRALS